MQQQNSLAQAQGSIAMGLIQVYRALGGGWEIRLTGCDPNELSLQGAPRPSDQELPAPRRLTGSVPPTAETLPVDAPRAQFGMPSANR